MKSRTFTSAVFAVAAFALPAALPAIGTYSKGRVLVQKLTKFESRGLIWESYEGEAEVATFDKSEKCAVKENQCFTPKKLLVKFSVRKDNAKVVNFLRMQKDQGGFVLLYRIHRIEAAALEEDMEVEDFAERVAGKPEGIEDRTALAEKPGSRSFSVQGRIVELASRGTMYSTYEGLYEDTRTGKVHPFSINDDKLAQIALKAMASNGTYYLGISQAKVSVRYSSDHFLYEINFKEEAGGVVAKEEPKKMEPPAKEP